MSSQSFFRASFASLVVAFASSAFAQKQQVIVDADFSKSTVTSAESDSVTVGNVTFMSTKKALSVVELEGGRKVLRIRPQNNVQVRVVFPATPAVRRSGAGDADAAAVPLRCAGEGRHPAFRPL